MGEPQAITFTVDGQPVPQPRARTVVVHGRTMSFVPRQHPIHAYRQAVAMVARGSGVTQRDGPVRLEVECVIARPPSHWSKSGVRPKAPAFPPKQDWDNLGKGVCDALIGIAFHDDDQVVDGRVLKRYAARSEPARTVVTIAGA